MTKDDIIDTMISLEPSLKRRTCLKIYDAFFQYIYISLLQHGSFRIPNIGTLTVTTRKETNYMNPHTQIISKKPTHKRLKFTISSKIKNHLNQ